MCAAYVERSQGKLQEWVLPGKLNSDSLSLGSEHLAGPALRPRENLKENACVCVSMCACVHVSLCVCVCVP